MKSFKIITLLLVAILLQAKDINIENSYALIANDTLSPIMEYSFSSTKVRGLKNDELGMFSKPRLYAKDRFAYFVSTYAEMEGFYEEFGNTPTLNFVYDEEAEIRYKSKKYLSLSYTMYMYEGGAHGNWFTKHWIIDRKSGEVLDFEDIFFAGCEDKLHELNNIALQQSFPDEDIEDILFDIDYPVSKDIYMLDKGIVFQYDPYEIAAYVFGSIEIFVSWEKLNPYLKFNN